MKPVTSFISEHSAEYLIVPKLLQILAADFETVIPLFFWATREGGIWARESLRQNSFKVLALYPRRPKIQCVGAAQVYLKLNQMLFERSSEFEKKGIPVIAGLPLVSDLMECKAGATCLWLLVHPGGTEEEMEISIHDPVIHSSSASSIAGGDFKAVIAKYCRSIGGEELIGIFRQARFGFNEYARFSMFNDLYKPTYILIADR